jgi:hypothetical protein
MELTLATMDWANKYVKAEKCKELYMSGNYSGSISIWEVTSSEEMSRNCMEYPLFDYAHLCNRGRHEKILRFEYLLQYSWSRVRAQ